MYPGSPLRVVLTYGYWQRRFGGAENVDRPAAGDRWHSRREVIGVLPSSFKFLRTRPGVVLPMPLDVERAARHQLRLSGAGAAEAGRHAGTGQRRCRAPDLASAADLRATGAAAERAPAGRRCDRQRRRDPVDSARGCRRRAAHRLRECGEPVPGARGRTASGIRACARRSARVVAASRARCSPKSVVLALAGGALGVALAQVATGLLRTIAPAELPRVDDIGIDATVLLFTLGVSLLSGVLFGLFAVLRFGNPEHHGAQGRRPLGRRCARAPPHPQCAGRRPGRTGADAADRLGADDSDLRRHAPGRSGFHAARTKYRRSSSRYRPGLISDAEQAARTHQRVAERLAQVPGVSSVGLSSSITMDGEDNGNAIDVEEFPVPEGQLTPLRRFKSVAPGYFETMGNHLVAGRSITWSEIFEQRPVIVISAALAREYWSEPARGDRQARAVRNAGNCRGARSSAWSATSATMG